MPVQKLPLDPDVAEMAPSATTLTAYDQEHLVTYLRLLDADADGADWREVARIVLHIDPDPEPDRARHAFDSHLSCMKKLRGSTSATMQTVLRTWRTVSM